MVTTNKLSLRGVFPVCRLLAGNKLLENSITCTICRMCLIAGYDWCLIFCRQNFNVMVLEKKSIAKELGHFNRVLPKLHHCVGSTKVFVTMPHFWFQGSFVIEIFYRSIIFLKATSSLGIYCLQTLEFVGEQISCMPSSIHARSPFSIDFLWIGPDFPYSRTSTIYFPSKIWPR